MMRNKVSVSKPERLASTRGAKFKKNFQKYWAFYLMLSIPIIYLLIFLVPLLNHLSICLYTGNFLMDIILVMK